MAKKRSCLCTEDCESSVTMRVRCRRAYLVIVIPLLIAVSLFINGYLFLEHRKVLGPMDDDDDDVELNNVTVQDKPNIVQEFFAQKKRGGNKNRGRQGRGRKRQKEKVPPRPESLAANATFSACLLIKDDNEILNEWLAYHYHTINLRHLIVAVDPLSSESPHHILQKWRTMTDLEVLEWTDAHYMPVEFLRTHKPPRKYMQKREDFDKSNLTHSALLEISNHRYRQRVFLAKCMTALRQKGSTWLAHIDTDEYIVASKLLRQMKPDYLQIPSMEEPGSVLNLIRQTVRKTPEQVSYPCISMLRVLFGSVESENEEIIADVPQPFDAKRFETLRWRYHALPHNMSNHGNPKVILDVSAIPEARFPNDIVFSIHRPVEHYCHKNTDLTFTNFRKQPIGVNHYLGSWERYAGRNDKRRSREVYDMKAKVKRGKDDGVRPWLKGFVRSMSLETASKLLGTEYLTETDSLASVI